MSDGMGPLLEDLIERARARRQRFKMTPGQRVDAAMAEVETARINDAMSKYARMRTDPLIRGSLRILVAPLETEMPTSLSNIINVSTGMPYNGWIHNGWIDLSWSPSFIDPEWAAPEFEWTHRKGAPKDAL